METISKIMKGKKTYTGILLLVGGFVASKYGYAFTEDDAVQIVDTIGIVLTSIGGILATYGRIKATKDK